MGISDQITAASRVWKLQKVRKELTGFGTGIAILDTAINGEHPLLNHPVNKNDFLFLKGPVVKTDHGTVCASVAVGNQDGVAPYATLYSYRIAEYSSHSAKAAVSNNLAVIAALDDIKMNKEKNTVQIDVVSMSCALYENDQHEAEIRRRIEELSEMGVTFVAAGGNLGRYEPISPIPARFEDCVISVGALDSHGDESRITSDGRIDVWAPEENITDRSLWGTSFATPAIAGLILLLKQWAKKIGPPTSDDIQRVPVLRRTFWKDMVTLSERGKYIFYPIEFLQRIITKKEILREIVAEHVKELNAARVDPAMDVNN